jgi:hypothetical protein
MLKPAMTPTPTLPCKRGRGTNTAGAPDALPPPQAGEGRGGGCRVAVLLTLALLLAGCGAAGSGWTRPGADEATTESAYRDCRALTDTATRTDSDIDQDIAASRGSDLQRSGVVREHAQQIESGNRDRADAILSSCMQAKGFSQGK